MDVAGVRARELKKIYLPTRVARTSTTTVTITTVSLNPPYLAVISGEGRGPGHASKTYRPPSYHHL